MFVQLGNSLIAYWAVNIPALYFTCVLVNYFGLGGMWAIAPTLSVTVFGLSKGPSVYTLIMFSSTFASLMNIFTLDVLLDLTSYLTCFYIGSLITIIVIIILCSFEEKLDYKRLARSNALVKVQSGTLDSVIAESKVATSESQVR